MKFTKTFDDLTIEEFGAMKEFWADSIRGGKKSQKMPQICTKQPRADNWVIIGLNSYKDYLERNIV